MINSSQLSEVQTLFVSRYKEFIGQLAKDYDKAFDSDPMHNVMVEDMEYVHPRVVVWKRKTPTQLK
jgi:hypothetical protein